MNSSDRIYTFWKLSIYPRNTPLPALTVVTAPLSVVLSLSCFNQDNHTALVFSKLLDRPLAMASDLYNLDDSVLNTFEPCS